MEIENNKNDESEKQVSSDMEKKTKREELILDIIASLLLFVGVGGIFTTATGWIITDKFNFDIFSFISFFAGKNLLRRETRGKDAARLFLGFGLFISIFVFIMLSIPLFFSFTGSNFSFKLTEVIPVLGLTANVQIFSNAYVEAAVGFFLLGLLIWFIHYSYRFLKRKTVAEKCNVVGRKRNLVNVVITLALICCISDFYAAFIIKKSLEGIQFHEINVVAVDEGTGEELPISVHHSSMGIKSKLYNDDVNVATSATGVVLHWISNQGAEVRISSKGYCQKKVKLPINESSLTVKLSKCTHH